MTSHICNEMVWLVLPGRGAFSMLCRAITRATARRQLLPSMTAHHFMASSGLSIALFSSNSAEKVRKGLALKYEQWRDSLTWKFWKLLGHPEWTSFHGKVWYILLFFYLLSLKETSRSGRVYSFLSWKLVRFRTARWSLERSRIPPQVPLPYRPDELTPSLFRSLPS